MIRITKRVIRIPILVGFHEDHDLNRYSSDSNQATKKVWIVAQQLSDLNPSSMDSNPNSSKGYFDGLIRITIQVIRLPGEEEEKLRATDSNHPYSNLNPSWRTSEEIKARIRITYTAIRIPHEE